MNCSNIRPLLSAYYDNDVSTEERTQVERHLAGCEDCRRALAEFRAIGSDIRSMTMPQPPAGLRRDVWRAIGAQQTGSRVFKGSSSRGVVTVLPQPQERAFLPNMVRGLGRSWAVALPAALVIGGLLLVLSVLLLRSNFTAVPVASMLETDAISSYGMPVHVKLSKQVIHDEILTNTSVFRMESGQAVTITNEVGLSYDDVASILAIQPNTSWTPGVEYKVNIDAPNVRLTGVGNLDSKPITLSFSAAAYTPTPTSTPTNTPIPTETPVVPTNTPRPTTVAENSPEPTQGQVQVPPTQEVPPTQVPVQSSPTSGPKASPTVRVNPSNTPLVQPTNTAVAPTNTPVVEPTHTALPTVTPVVSPTAHATQPVPTSTAVVTATPHHGTPTATTTATATPRGGSTATPTPVNTACDQVPVRGFGQIWQSNLGVRNRIGCAAALEMAIPEVAFQHFQGGLMVWRADLKQIYVFITNANSQSGIWVQFPDTWQDTDTAVHAAGTPTPGLFEPIRGFGKLWNSNGYVRQSLGWATDQEVGGLTGAWQEFENGEALWTSDLNIYFMYSDDSFQHFIDTWVAPEE